MQGGINRTAVVVWEGEPMLASCPPYSSTYSRHWIFLETGVCLPSLYDTLHPRVHYLGSWHQGTFRVTVRGQCPETHLFRCPLAIGPQIYPCGWARHWEGLGEPRTSPALEPALLSDPSWEEELSNFRVESLAFT